MIRYILARPIAVLLSFIAVLLLGCILFWKIPVSLLPNAAVPKIIIRANFLNHPALTIEKDIIKPIRENLATLKDLKSIESRSNDHVGVVYLTYEYGTRMDLAYIEANEKIDYLAREFPKDFSRPQVSRINTADIPVIRVQVIPRKAEDFSNVSNLTGKLIKRRFEQIAGISWVDINGAQKELVELVPDKDRMMALGISDDLLTQSIEQANSNLGGISLRSGNYRYFITLANGLGSADALKKIPIRLPAGSVISMGQVADIRTSSETQTGYHLFNGKRSIVLSIQKQPASRMNELIPKIRSLVGQLSEEYPQIKFDISQDQSFLLEAGINNLYQDIVYGGALTVLLLFMFLGNFASPFLISISIPLSLIMTFVFFYIFNISFNIISLSGLALGIGMLIDNSIVVIDSITRKQNAGMDIVKSSIDGTNEVLVPVISQVLTTVAVYAPLILLNGIAGTLVFDQSIALTISLCVSLVIAFVLSPLLYKMLLGKGSARRKQDTRFYKLVSRGYHSMIDHILRHKVIYLSITLFMMPAGIWIATKLPISSLPKIEKRESLLKIRWNEPIDAEENLHRTKSLQAFLKPYCLLTEADVGISQFLVHDDDDNVEDCNIYYLCHNAAAKQEADKKINEWLATNYKEAGSTIADAPNALVQLFAETKPWLEAKFKPATNTGDTAWDLLTTVLKKLPIQTYKPGMGMIKTRNVELRIDDHKTVLYRISRSEIEKKLLQLFGFYTITEIKSLGDMTKMRLSAKTVGIDQLGGIQVISATGTSYPLSGFLSFHFAEHPKTITADHGGEYRSIEFPAKIRDVKNLQKSISHEAALFGYRVDFSGSYFENWEQIKNLWEIFLIVLLLLYIILAIQYESLLQPLIVMLTIPLGITGGMLGLWISGGTMDVMAAIGFIVILGLIVDDPILKIETLNRLHQKYQNLYPHGADLLLRRIIHEAGDICLKPLLLVSLTTSIALVPVLFIGGLGNDLQKPLAVVIIGGLTIGTFFTTWFIPIAYWYVSKHINPNARKAHA